MTEPKLKPQNIIALIPARGQSMGLPRKNIRLLDGKPLVAYAIEAAKNCHLVNRVIVSTDDSEIAKIAKKYGAETPFKRPKRLAGAFTPTEPVLKHAVEWLEKNEHYQTDIVVFLQATDQFRKKGLIEKAVKELLKNEKLDSAFVATPTHKNFWRKQDRRWARLASDIPYGGPRQKRELLYREDTGLACATRARFIKQGRRIGDKIAIIINDPAAPFIDIHDEFDLWLAEKILQTLKKTKQTEQYEL